MTYTQWVHTEPYSSWFQTLFQLVQGKMCLISSDLIAFLLVRLSASSTGDCYVCYELIGQVVQGTEQVLSTAMIRLDLIALCP